MLAWDPRGQASWKYNEGVDPPKGAWDARANRMLICFSNSGSLHFQEYSQLDDQTISEKKGSVQDSIPWRIWEQSKVRVDSATQSIVFVLRHFKMDEDKNLHRNSPRKSSCLAERPNCCCCHFKHFFKNQTRLLKHQGWQVSQAQCQAGQCFISRAGSDDV